MLETVLMGAALFAATNVDDIFVLVGFFSDPRFRSRQVVGGQFLGISALVGASLVAALVALVIPPAYIGLLGLAPIAIGVKALFALRSRRDEEDESAPATGSGPGRLLAVAAVTIANGGDNIGVYTPVFATQPPLNVAVMVGVFTVMTAIWCLAGHWLVHHRVIGAPLRRYGPRLVPIVLIGLGFLILWEADTFDLLRR